MASPNRPQLPVQGQIVGNQLIIQGNGQPAIQLLQQIQTSPRPPVVRFASPTKLQPVRMVPKIVGASPRSTTGSIISTGTPTVVRATAAAGAQIKVAGKAGQVVTIGPQQIIQLTKQLQDQMKKLQDDTESADRTQKIQDCQSKLQKLNILQQQQAQARAKQQQFQQAQVQGQSSSSITVAKNMTAIQNQARLLIQSPKRGQETTIQKLLQQKQQQKLAQQNKQGQQQIIQVQAQEGGKIVQQILAPAGQQIMTQAGQQIVTQAGQQIVTQAGQQIVTQAGQQIQVQQALNVLQIQQPGSNTSQKIVLTKEHLLQIQQGKPLTLADLQGAQSVPNVQPGQVISLPQQAQQLLQTAGSGPRQVQVINLPTAQLHGQTTVIRTLAPQPTITQPKSILPTTRAPPQVVRKVAPATNVGSLVQVTTNPGQAVTYMARPRTTATVNTTQNLPTMALLPKAKIATTVTNPTGAVKPALKTLLPSRSLVKKGSSSKSIPKVVMMSSDDVAMETTVTTTAAPSPSELAVRGSDVIVGTTLDAMNGMGVEEVEVDTTPTDHGDFNDVRTNKDQKEKQKHAKFKRQQDKANRIILEAIKKAKQEGRPLPPHPEPVLLPPEESETKRSKSKRSPRPKGEKKERSERPKKEKKELPKPLMKKKSSKRKNLFLEKRRYKKRRHASSDEDGSENEEMADVKCKAKNRKFYIPSDDEGDFKRRSGRHSKRKKYNDEVDLDLSEERTSSSDVDVDDTGPLEKEKKKEKKKAPVEIRKGAQYGQFFVENPDEDESQLVEKILGMRIGTRTRPRPEVDQEILDYDDIEVPEAAQETIQVEEFYVKYKNFSYLHCEWKTDSELKGDPRIQQKIKRFKQVKLPYMDRFLTDEEDLFNQDYLEVDRVLEKSITVEPPNNEKVIHYLVKWRSLPYEDATWELDEDVDNTKVGRWASYQVLPPPDERDAIARPRPCRWEKITKSEVYNNGNVLRDYQLEGVNWLSYCYHNRQNCILADEMGLGKTIQSITFLKNVYDYGIHGPYLVIVPLSTLANWQREFDLWTNMNAVVYHGSSASRSMIAQYELYFNNEKGGRIPDIYKFHALITTYEMIITDAEYLSVIDWRLAVIDEAHRLKNKNCKLAEGLKCFDMEHKVLLTGTPLQNNVEELFSLLNFLEPQRFSNTEEFMKDFGELRTESQVKQLKGLLKPMMLRRLKEDVEKSLAPKEETIVEVELTNMQKKYYRAILERNFTFLTKGGSTSNVPNLMNTMMELRKCCNHPYLIDGAEQRILSEMKETRSDCVDPNLHALIHSCGKLVLIDKLLPKLYAGNHRVLVFSQMIRVLDLLEDYLIHKRYLYERLDGRIRGNQRQEAIDRFSKPDSDRFVFLLCTRAGGLGINLTAADTVIIYDSDWNPQNDLQAQARCHRIGQQKAVKIYRLITRNSYEREMFDKASMKLGLDKAVLQSGKENDSDKPALSKREVEDLLKRGAYGAVMDDDETADRFCEEDIDLILKRRTQVIQIENEGKGSVFAKASFSSRGNRNDIDIDDPEFWQKWAKKAEIDPEAGQVQCILEEPRKRKQTARYGNEDIELNMEELDNELNSSDSDDSKNDGEDKDKKKKDKEKDKEKEKKKVKRKRKPKESASNEPEQSQVPPAPIDHYLRSEMFKVEKLMMTYGWGRWDEIQTHAKFRRRLIIEDVVKIAKAMLIYSLRFYAGDGRIKRFIYDLVCPKEDVDYRNHQGLSAPVPRGRKGKKCSENCHEIPEEEENSLQSTCEIQVDKILPDENYKKHLQRHANKILLRVRLLYYLKGEIIGDENADMIMAGVPADVIDIPPPGPECNIKPCDWWDDDADKSLLIGVFKHGFEKLNAMRQDPCLIFLERCGPPDGKALAKEQQNDEDDFDASYLKNKADDIDNDDLDIEHSQGQTGPGGGSRDGSKVSDGTDQTGTVDGKLLFPSDSDLNTRLRRVITGYQKLHKRALHKMAKHEKKLERIEAVTKEREQKKREKQQGWSRREETDFYRIVSTFGVEYDVEQNSYRWDKFRSLAKLEKKYVDTMTEYFLAFYYMCCKVCKRLREDASPPNDQIIEPITEERATRCLARVDLLNKLREETLRHSLLDQRLKLCEFTHELPSWWRPGEHDRDLLIGAARHGLARTDYNILHDPELVNFREIVQNKSMYIPPSSAATAMMMQRYGPDSDSEEDARQKTVTTMQRSPDIRDALMSHVKTERSLKEESITGSIPGTPGTPGSLTGITSMTAMTGVSHSPPSQYDQETAVKKIVDKIKEETNVKLERCDTPRGDDDLDPDANEPTVAELLAKNVAPAIHWPKDRAIFHRLEQVCTCIDRGEWPQPRRRFYDMHGESLNTTPVGTPRPATGSGESPDMDSAEFYSQTEGLKLTIGKKKKGGSCRKELDSMMNGDSEHEWNQELSGPYPQKKRGRRSKVEKLLLETAQRQMIIEKMMEKAKGRLDGFDNPVFHVPVVNLESGDRLSGEEAPQRRVISDWLDKNPGYIIDLPWDPEDDLSNKWAKKPRRHKIDPTKLDLDKLTGQENVSVVNTVTGKRVTGAKAPELRYLGRFLEHNPNYYVDSKWAQLVKLKANLPERYISRILPPPGDKKSPATGNATSTTAPRLPQHTHPLMQQISLGQSLLGASLQGGLNLAGVPAGSLVVNPSLLGLQHGDKAQETLRSLLKVAQQQQQATSASSLPIVYNTNMVMNSKTGLKLPSNSVITANMTMAEAQQALLNGNIVIDDNKTVLKKVIGPGDVKIGKTTQDVLTKRPHIIVRTNSGGQTRAQLVSLGTASHTSISTSTGAGFVNVHGAAGEVVMQDVQEEVVLTTPEVTYMDDIPMMVEEEVVTEEVITETEMGMGIPEVEIPSVGEEEVIGDDSDDDSDEDQNQTLGGGMDSDDEDDDDDDVNSYGQEETNSKLNSDDEESSSSSSSDEENDDNAPQGVVQVQDHDSSAGSDSSGGSSSSSDSSDSEAGDSESESR